MKLCPMSRLLHRLCLLAACLLPVGMAAADASRTNTTLDLRMPDLRSIPMLDQITVPADSEELGDISIIGASPPEEGTSNLHVARTGFGSLYWAARHPAQAWKVMLPITADEEPTIVEDIRVDCALFATPLAEPAPCL